MAYEPRTLRRNLEEPGRIATEHGCAIGIPAPDQEVYWAEQSWDEMFNGRIDFSVDKLDLRLEEKKPQTEQQ